jgi:hypothetical protein
VFQNKSVILCETGYLDILWTQDYCSGEDTLRNSFKTNQITRDSQRNTTFCRLLFDIGKLDEPHHH